MILLRTAALLLSVTTGLAETPTRFLFPSPTSFVRDAFPGSLAPLSANSPSKLTAHPINGLGETWVFTDRVVLWVGPTTSLNTLLAGRALTLSRTVEPGIHILQAPNAILAWQEAAELAAQPAVLAAYPVHHPPRAISDGYAPAPNDEFFRTRTEIGSCEIEPNVVIPGQVLPGQWYLENRDPGTGAVLGVDINIRPAWALSRGEGVTVALADTGVELNHHDLTNALTGNPHFNFVTGLADGSPIRSDPSGAHGTSAAGLIAATANNGFGISGVAPESQVASWVIFDSAGFPASDERIGDMFRFASNAVSVQNHSWVPVGQSQHGPDVLEESGLASAWSEGRNGLGTVMIFAAGNGRAFGKYANDNGFASDPRTIGVTGVTPYGRATATAEPGSSILVAAPTGDDEFGGLFTTDLSGPSGANFLSFCPDSAYLSDFRWGALGFKDTSAAAPLVSGIAALMLSANPGLSARDVQQILLLSAWHADWTDPDVKTNSVGLVVSHNVGFGIVDAGEAVRLAKVWTNRPPVSRLVRSVTGNVPIPDGGFRVEVVGEHTPAELAFIPGIPGFGIQPDRPMAFLPLVDIGRATNAPAMRLDGRGALIERGDILYSAKLKIAAAAGAAFAIVYNMEISAPGACPGGDQLCVPTGTDFSPIPVIFVGRTAGLALRDLIQSDTATRVRIALNGTQLSFSVDESWQCERVGVRLKTDYSVRGDLRITLTSPSGTTSILQRYNGDTGPGPSDWTYWSTHHYFEPSGGTWTLAVTDEAPGEGTGQVLAASLIVEGVPLTDSDHDGLDDHWELTRLGTLGYGPMDDPDGDGYSNLRESLEGSDPVIDERNGAPDVAFFNDELVRVSWPGRQQDRYRFQTSAALGDWSAVTEVPGRFPVTATMAPAAQSGHGFYRVEPLPGGTR